MQKYLLFGTDGGVSVIECEGVMPLDQMQKIVGGYIEHTRVIVMMNEVPVRLEAFVNEQGWLIPLKPNPFFPDLAGPVLCGTVNAEGDFLGVQCGVDVVTELIPKEDSYGDKSVEARRNGNGAQASDLRRRNGEG